MTTDLATLIEAQMAGDSDFVLEDFVRVRYLDVVIQGYAAMDLELSWQGHPGPPPLQPTVNSAVTLQKFIDATGVAREASRTPTPDHLTVVVNPRHL